jgi:drug/metabolite transporter (DMT)-like permease
VILGVWRGIGGSSLNGQLMCLLAACCYGVSIPYTKRFVAPLPYSGLVMSAFQLSFASVLVAFVAPLVSGGVPQVTALRWTVVVAVVLLGAIGTGLAFVINMHNIRIVGASTASMVTYLVPVFATAIGVLVLHERLEWYQPVGAVVVLAGVAISQNLGGRRLRHAGVSPGT